MKFEDYDMAGMKTEEGISIAGGAKAAWFKDTEGNVDDPEPLSWQALYSSPR
jgi:hypothetical protein